MKKRKNGERSVWVNAFIYSLIVVLVVSVLSTIFYFSYLRYIPGSDFAPSSGNIGDPQEGLIIFISPVIPHIYFMEVLGITLTFPQEINNLSRVIFFLIIVAIYLPYYLVGLLIAYLRKKYISSFKKRK